MRRRKSKGRSSLTVKKYGPYARSLSDVIVKPRYKPRMPSAFRLDPITLRVDGDVRPGKDCCRILMSSVGVVMSLYQNVSRVAA